MAERARYALPSFYARRDAEERFQQEQALKEEQLRLAEKAQKAAHGEAEDANLIALGNLGVTGLLGAQLASGLGVGAAGAPATATGIVGEGLAAQVPTGGSAAAGVLGPAAAPVGAGLAGGLLGSQLGGMIAGGKRRREGKVAGGVMGGAAAGTMFAPGPGTLIGAGVGAGVGLGSENLKKAPGAIVNTIGNAITSPRSFAEDVGGVVENIGEKAIDVVDDIVPDCIAIGYIYGSHSKQWKYARIFCARHMSYQMLDGYYRTGEWFIDKWNRWPNTKIWGKKLITEPFYHYMLYRLDRRKASIPLKFYGWLWMKTFKWVGRADVRATELPYIGCKIGE
jgi:hypothetical protein